MPHPPAPQGRHLDLHRHLEGAHSARALLTVAQRFSIQTPLFFDPRLRAFRSAQALSRQLQLEGPSADPTLFYQCIVRARAAYVSVEAIGVLAQLAFEEGALDTDGFEMRLSLFSMARTLLDNLGLAWREVEPALFAERYARPILLAVVRARDAVQARTGVSMLLRLGFSRTFESAPHYRAMAQMAAEHAKALVGLDVLGIVVGQDREPLPQALLDILQGLRKHLPDLTVHAGEFEGPDSVERTLALEPRGIGHGIQSLYRPATLERLAREGVTLEVCPTSNSLLVPGVVAQLALEHGGMPLQALQRAQVHCVLGSDDPTPMGTTFGRELEVARAGGVDLAKLDADALRRWTQLTGALPRFATPQLP